MPDYRPLGYYPLSLWSWQDAIEGRVPRPRQHRRRIRAFGVVRVVLDDGCRASSALKSFVKPSRAPGVHAVQRVPARPLPVPVLRARRRRISPFDHVIPRHCGGARRPGRTSSQPARPATSRKGGTCRRRRRCGRCGGPYEPTVLSSCTANGGLFPPNYLHESWMDYLYWDSRDWSRDRLSAGCRLRSTCLPGHLRLRCFVQSRLSSTITFDHLAGVVV